MKSKKSNKILSIMLSLALTLTMFPMMTGAAYAENDLGVSEPGVTTDAELRSAISNVSENGTVQLAGNIALTSALTVNNGKTFTLTGGSNKYSLTRGSGCAGTMLNVTSGNVTLSNITVNGNNGGADFLVKVGAANASPTLTLGSGAKIVNGTGGGILVGCNGNAGGYGTLNIQDGSEISGMTGCGTVKNGSASTNASGVLVMGTNTHFNMTGGTIENNNAASWGTLVFYNNKGNATAEISGGSITGNKNSKGGGAGAILVDTNGRLTLNGGSITKNETTAGEYGGVRLFADSSELYIGGYNDNEGSGNPLVVTENTVNGVESNIKLNGKKTIGRVTGRTLAAGSDIGVSLCSMPGKTGAKTKVVTSSVESELAYFHSDQPTKAGMVRGAGNDTAIYLSYDAREIVVSISLPTGLKLADGSGDLTQTVDGSGTNEFKSIVIEPTDRQATTFTNSTLTTLNSALGGGNLTASIKNGNLVIDLANGKTSKDINSVTIGTGSFNTASNYYNVYGGTSTVGETEDNNKMNARYDAESGKLTWDCNQTGKLAFYPTSGGVTEYTGFTRFYCRAYVRDNGAETELTKTSGNLDVGGGKNIHNETYCSQSTTSPYILIKSWLTDTTKQGTLWIKVMPCNISQTLNQNCYFWINAGEIEQIKATLVDFGSLPETGVSIEDKSLLKQYVNGNAAIQNVVLKPTSGYLLTERETTAINTALAGSGLTATLTNGDIEISGAPSRAVQINLKAILGNITPTTVQATVTASGGTREGSYASVGDAMSATSTSGATITANGSNLTPVTGGTLSSGVTLVTKAGTFTAKDGNATINMDSDGKVTLTSGALEVGKNESADGSVTGKSGKVITNTSESSVDGEKKITITADSENNMDTVTAVASGSKVKIGGENGAEYETAAENTSLTVDSIGKVTLTGGSVKLDKTATEGQAEEAVTIGTTTVKNTSAAGSSGATPQITVTAVTGDSEDKTGTIAIPQGGEATIGSAVIGNASTGGGEESVTVDVSKNEDNSDKLTVNIPAGGKVTIDGVTYAAGSGENDASLIVNPGTGKVTTITGTVSTTVPESSWNDEDFSYELKAGETLTVGGYTYTAGNDSQVTLTGRSSENPIVTLGTDSSRVTVKKKEQPAENAGVTYTAASANTKFAISANDTDATKIDLLDNGNESANSKVKLPGGATAYGTADGNDGADSITGIANGETVVTTDSTGKLILVSGSGSSTGSMTATVGGENHSFERNGESGSYTVSVGEANTLTLNTGNASVKMDDKVSFASDDGKGAFGLEKGTDGSLIVKGVAISDNGNTVYGGTITGSTASGKADTVSIVDGGTQIEVSGDGRIKLVGGSGTSTGTMTATIDKIGDKSFSGDGRTKYTVETEAGKVTIAPVTNATSETTAGAVTMSSGSKQITFTGLQGEKATAADFTLGREITNNNLTATVPSGASITGKSGGNTTGSEASQITINGVAETGKSNTKVEIDKSTGKMTLVDGKATITAGNSNVTVTVAYKIETNGKVTGVKTVEVTIPTGRSYTANTDSPGNSVASLAASGTTGKETIGTGDSSFEVSYSLISQTGETTTTPTEEGENTGITGVSGANIKDITTAGSTAEEGIRVIKNETSGKDTVTIPAGRTVSITYPAAAGAGTQTVQTYTVAAGGSSATLLVEKIMAESVQTGVKVSLVNGKVELASGTEAGSGESITGIAGKTIKNTSGSGDKTITVEANNINATDAVAVPQGGKVTIGTTEFETAGDGAATHVVNTDGRVTLTSGAVELDKNESIIGKSGQTITNTSESSVDGEKKITITADSENNMDTVTAVASGSKVKIGGENGAEYETAAENTSLTVDSIGKVTLTGGSVKLDKTATEGQAEEAVTIGTTTVKNTSAAGSSGATPQITVTAVTGDSEDKTGTIAIPQGGEATIGSAVIGNASTGGGEESVTVDVSKNEDNSDKLTVNIPAGGKVTIDGVTYAAGSGENDASLIVNPGTGKVTTITGTVSTTVPESSWNDEDFSYELKAGETLTVGGYTYTAGNDSQVTLTGRSSENPIVTLGTDSSRVTVKKKEQPAENAGVTYTAASANTKFAISANDTDATKIDLLDNGNESANSKVKLPGGATAYGTADGNDGADSITGIANGETVVTTDSTGKLILVSGSGSSTGSMTATVGGESKNFETTDSKKYTITISETTSTVEISELAVGSQAGTVAMEVGAASKITFTGAANAAFTLDSEADDTTGVTVPSGATVSGVDNKVIKGEAAAEGETATKVKIDSAGSLTLVAGKGSSTGDMKAAFDNKTYSFSKTSGGEDGAAGGYSVDATAKTLTVEGGVAVQDTDSKAKYTGQGDSSATFTMDADGSVTIEKDGVITGNDGTADVDSIIGVEASAGASKTKVKVGEDGKLTLVGGSGTSTGTMTATIAGVGDKNFAADENNKYTVDATAGRLVLDEAGSVNMGTRITLAGEANAEFAIGKTGSEGSAKTTLAVPAGAGVSAVAGENATATVKGVAKNAEAEPAEKETKVEIDSAGNLALVEGKAEVTGESTLKVPVKNGGNISYYVDITIPDGTTCAIDAGDGKVKVTEAGKSVTIDGITCTAGKADSVFSIDSVKLTNDGDRAMIPAGKYAAVTVGEASDAKIVNVSGGNIGKTTITRGEPISVNIAAAGDSFSVNGVEYKAKEGNTTYTIDKNGKVTLVGSGNGSSSAIIPSGGKVENTSADKNTGVEATTIATVKPTTSTTDGNKKSAITIDEQIGDKIVENSISNKSTEVVVDAQTSKTLTETAAGGSEEIALPEKTVQELSAKTEASVTIKSDATEIKLDKKAVDGLASQAGSDGYVRLIVETVKQEPKLHEVALKLVTSKGVVTDFKGGNVNVTVKLNDTLAASDLVCVYIDDYSIYHMVTGAKNTDGTYRFTTGHFSTYAIMARPEAERTIAEQTAKVKELAGKIQLKARSVKTKKGNIKVTLKITKGANSFKALEDMGYTLKYRFYRSTKKAASYKAKFETYKKPYTNTDAKKGVRYYYKARVLVYDGEGNLIAKTKLGKCWYATRIR